MNPQNKTTMNFKSLPTTSEQQSQTLLKAGLNPKTADCYIEEDGHTIIARDDYDLGIALDYRNLTPSWSLSRLLDMMPFEVPDSKSGYKPHHPELIKRREDYVLSIRRSTADCLVGTHIEDNPIECAVSMIGWLIRKNHFNKEYLKKK